MFFTSCSLNNEQLKRGWWKYGDGYYIGDVIDFEKYDLVNDTLYLRDIPKAVLFDSKKSLLGFTNRKIIIKDINSNTTGVYYQK